MRHLPNVISALRMAGAIGLLFLAVPTIFRSLIPLAIVAAVATFAAVQAGHFIRLGKMPSDIDKEKRTN